MRVRAVSICSVARNIYMVTETMASFDEERTTIAADSSDSSDAKKTNNNGGIEHNSHDLNGENTNIYRVINDSGDMACIEASSKMEGNQLNEVSTTATEIDDAKNGTSASTRIEDNAIAENNSILTHEKSVQLPLVTESAVHHVEKTRSPVVVASGKHVSSDKSKSNSSSARHSSGSANKSGERSQHPQHPHHSSKSQTSDCGKFGRDSIAFAAPNDTVNSIADDSARVHKKKKKDRDREKDRGKEGNGSSSNKERSKDKSHSKNRHHSSSSSSTKPTSKSSEKINGANASSSSCSHSVAEPIVATTKAMSPKAATSTVTSNSIENNSLVSSEPTQSESASLQTATESIDIVAPEEPANASNVIPNKKPSAPVPSPPPFAQSAIGDVANGSSPLKCEQRVVAPPASNEAAVPPMPITIERKPTEGAGIVIKKDYLPSPAKKIRVEKTREDVTRVLNYETESNCSLRPSSAGMKATVEVDVKTEIKIKTEPIEAEANVTKVALGPSTAENISENKENAVAGHETKVALSEMVSVDAVQSAGVKVEATTIGDTHNERKSIKEGNHHHSSSTISSKTTTSTTAKSSSRRSSSSSNRECSRCYRRSKIKRTSVGIQCRRFGEPFKYMTPTSTPLKATQTLMCNMADSLYSDLKYGRFFHVEVHTNGGASVVHMYQNEINSLSEAEMEELTEEFFRITFSEDENGWAHHVMGIVHGAAEYIPDLLEHMADNYSTLTVKGGVLGRNSDIETSTMAQYYEQVEKHYSQGTFRYGPLHQISLVGKVHEEVGGYFPDLLGRLEQNPFLQKVIFIFIRIHVAH